MRVRIDKILPNPVQPRRVFEADEMRALAESIREVGLIHPVVVVKSGDWFVLVDGERRYRACRSLGMTEIEVVVREEIPEQDMLVQALVANVQRADLNPIEEARAYQVMRDKMGMNQMEISRKTGTNLVRVSHRLSLLELPIELQDLIQSGEIPVDKRVVKVILSLPEEYRMEFARKIAGREMSIRQIQDAGNRLQEMLATSASRERMDVPAVDLADPGHVKPGWDMLAQAGVLPVWRIVVDSARKTCKECGWGDLASREVCKDCPAVQFVSLMNKKANEHDGNRH